MSEKFLTPARFFENVGGRFVQGMNRVIPLSTFNYSIINVYLYLSSNLHNDNNIGLVGDSIGIEQTHSGTVWDQLFNIQSALICDMP